MYYIYGMLVDAICNETLYNLLIDFLDTKLSFSNFRITAPFNFCA